MSGSSNHSACAVLRRRAAVAGEMRQASPIVRRCRARRHPDAHQRRVVQRPGIGQTAPTRPFVTPLSPLVTSLVELSDLSGRVPNRRGVGDDCCNSSKISSRRTVTGSADGGSVSSLPKADITRTLRTATDNNGTDVRAGRSPESRDPERAPSGKLPINALRSASRRTSPDGRGGSSTRGDR